MIPERASMLRYSTLPVLFCGSIGRLKLVLFIFQDSARTAQ